MRTRSRRSRPACWRGWFWRGSRLGGQKHDLQRHRPPGLIRDWFGLPLRELRPEDGDAYFGRVLRGAKPSARTVRAAARAACLQFLELRHQAGICDLTGRVAECPLGEVNRPRAWAGSQLYVVPGRSGSCWVLPGGH
ncbi:MAG: hypothetical protein ACRDOB_01635 [Streptosporangiaceae bacterium]